MESASIPSGRCPACLEPASARARFCRNCGAALASAPPIDGAAVVAGVADEARAHAIAVGAAVSTRVQAAWQDRPVRAPLIALGLTLLGTFLPWANIGRSGVSTSVTVSGLVGWVFPVALALLIAGAVIFYVTVPGRPTWLAVAAAGLSFVLAVLGTVVLAVLWISARVINGVVTDVVHLSNGVIHVSVGGWITVAAAVVLFVTTTRLACQPGPKEQP